MIQQAERTARAAGEPRRGGRLTILGHVAFDSLDPGRTYYMPGWQVVYATQRPLYSFPSEGATLEPVPDLAAAPPEISADRRTLVVRIRDGVRFSPPVEREVTAHDVKYALERFFTTSVGGQYIHHYSALEGAPETLGAHRPIPGIEVADERTLVFRLSRPAATAFAAALALPATVPVPEEYARPLDERPRSAYEHHVVFTGPYMVPAARDGELLGHAKYERLELVRNPSWDGAGDYRAAHLDGIVFEGTDNTPEIAERVLSGSGLVLGENPPVDVARAVVSKPGGPYEQVAAATVRYIPFNTSAPPFDDVNVRRAVVAGFDRVRLRDARGGPFVGPVATHFLPPACPGHEEAGGERGPDLDFLREPRGDLERSAEYFRRAGFAGGRYAGEPIVLLSSTDGPARAQAAAVTEQLERLGFRVDVTIVPNNEMYPEHCSVPEAHAPDGRPFAVYGSAPNWQPDLIDPQAMLEPLFASWAIRPQGNDNYAQLRDPAVDEAMRAAERLEGDDRIRAWAQVDRLVAAAAPGVPFVWERTTHLRSPDVHGAMNRYTSLWDVTCTYLDGGPGDD